MKRKLIIPVGMLVLSLLALGGCKTGHEHAYGSSWDKDGTHHWHTCTVEGCSEVSGKAEHTGGTATETEKAICEVCGESYGSLKEHEHAFTVSKVDAKYLVSAADCDSPAVYKKSCACGEAGTETFTDGEALGHTWATVWSSDETNHWHECTVEGCDGTDTKVAHSGGTATETEKAVCETCNQPYGELKPHVHVYSEVVDAKYLVSAADCDSAAVYKKSCSCGVAHETETFESGEALGHTYGEWETKTPADCENAEVEHRVCTTPNCGHEETRTGDAALGHKMTTKYDGTHHWTSCDNEGCQEATEKVAHFGGEATEEEKAVCEGCNQPYGELKNHEHTYGEWTTKTPATCTEAEVEHRICSNVKCGYEETRTGDAALGHDLEGVNWVESDDDETKHVKICKTCEEVVESEVHEDLHATCLEAAVCKCGVVVEAKLDHVYTGDYVDNENGTHSQKCINGCTTLSEGVAHVHSEVEMKNVTDMGGDFVISCECGYTYTLTINGQTDCDVALVETTDKLVLRATLKESVISGLQTALSTVHADVIAELEAWYKDIAPTEQVGYNKYIVYVGGKRATVTEEAPGSNNYVYKVAIRKDETMKVYKEGNPINVGESTDTVYTAQQDGVYTIYVNDKDQIWVDPTILGIPYNVYSLTVDGEAVSSENVAGSTEYAKFVVTLAVGEKLAVLGDEVELKSYTATKAGDHTVVVSKNNVVTITDPSVVMESITFHYYNLLNWTSVNLHAWNDGGANFTGGSWPGAALTEEGDGWWTITIEAEDFTGLKIIFNGSGGQTADLDYVDGLNYYYGTNGTGFATKEALLDSLPKAGEITEGKAVVVFNIAWAGVKTPYCNGVAMISTAGTDYEAFGNWYAEVDPSTTVDIDFDQGTWFHLTNNKEDNPDCNVPYTIEEGNVYVVSGVNWSHDGKGNKYFTATISKQ